MARRRESKRRGDFMRVVVEALEVAGTDDVTEEAVVRLLARGPLLDISMAEEKTLYEHYLSDGWQEQVRAWSKEHCGCQPRCENHEPWIEARERRSRRSREGGWPSP
ncbi:MAG: hypothetical protein WD739_08335 [Actinomycetota bacterium]